MSFLLNVLSASGQYRADKRRYKAQKALQDYNNKMTRIADAMNQNAITTNTTLAIQQSARTAVNLRREELTRMGASTVAAAAAGVRGRSVNNTLLNIQRGAGLKEKARQTDLEQQFLQFTQQRRGSALSAVQNQDLSYISKPSFATYMLGAVKQSVDDGIKAFTGGFG